MLRSLSNPAYACPDRAQWAKKHGVTPRELAVAARFIEQASAAVERDWSTLSEQEAIAAQQRLDDICASVHANTEPALGEMDMVFFDPATKSFWLYPAT